MAVNAKSSLDKKEQSLTNYLILVALGTLLILVAALIIGKNLFSQLLLNQRLIGEKQQIHNTLTSDQSALSSLKTQYDKLAPGIVTELGDALPSTADFPALAAMLEQIGNTSGTSTKSIAASSSVAAVTSNTAASTSSSYDVNVSVIATYAALQQYFHNLEVSARPVRINQVSFSGSSPALDVTISLTTYYKAGADASIFDQIKAFK